MHLVTVAIDLTSDQYLIWRPAFKPAGNAYRITDPEGRLVLLALRQGLRLRDEIRLYPDESAQTPALLLQARKALEFSGLL